MQADGKVVFVTIETDANVINFNSVIGRLIPSGTTGLDDIEFSKNYSLVPNPANEFIQIISKNKSKARILITDMMGRAVYQSDLMTATQINTNQLSNGIYSVSIQTDTKSVSTKLVVKH